VRQPVTEPSKLRRFDRTVPETLMIHSSGTQWPTLRPQPWPRPPSVAGAPGSGNWTETDGTVQSGDGGPSGAAVKARTVCRDPPHTVGV
jgi:hypothetical protein